MPQPDPPSPTHPEVRGNLGSHPVTDLCQQNIELWRNHEKQSFSSHKAAEAYDTRAKRIIDVIELREPDEVPVYLLAEGYIETYNDIQPRDIFYEPDTFAAALLKIHEDFCPDYAVDCYPHCGRALDTLGMGLIRWPGGQGAKSGLPGDTAFQYVEDEYMRADEYDELINSPEGYLLKKYLPRIWGNLGGLSMFPNAFKYVEASWMARPFSSLSKGTPARQAIELMLKAADQFSEVIEKYDEVYTDVRTRLGIPELFGGMTKAPFDIIGDTMRCTVGIVKDMYSRPEKVLAAAETLVPIAVQIGVETIFPGRSPLVLMPLHKGSDDFMSPEQFEQFYWPTLHATMQGIIRRGGIPVPFVEGSFNKRLEPIGRTPLTHGRSLWIFDRTDMRAAKEHIGSWGCVGGNVPASLFKQGTVKMLEEYCQQLIESCGPGGGFCLFPGTVIDRANPENIRAYLRCGHKFGRY